jgi:hypothetical protein
MAETELTTRSRDDATRARVDQRRCQALWWAWGREDAGDRRLRDASGERVLAFDFADFAAAECLAYVREDVCSLDNIGGQYGRYVAAVTPGSQFRHIGGSAGGTGDVYAVLNYNGTIHKVDCRVVEGGTDGGHLPVGYTFTLTPEQLAGRDYVLVMS